MAETRAETTNLPTPCTLSKLVEELQCVTDWETLGVHLGITEPELLRIELDYLKLNRRKIALFSLWMRTTTPNWEDVITALEKLSGPEKEIAENLRDKYGIRKRPFLSPTTRHLSMQPSTGRSVKVSSRDTLAISLREIKVAFAKLVMDTQGELEKRKVPFSLVKRFVSTFLDERVTFQSVKSLDSLFDKLHDFLDFLNPVLLKEIISEFIPKNLRRKFAPYEQQLERFISSTTVNEFKESVEIGAGSHVEGFEAKQRFCTVTLELSGPWRDSSMKDLQSLLRYLFSEKRQILSHIQIELGSVFVKVLAPKTALLSLIVLGSKKVKSFLEHGVLSVQIGSAKIYPPRANPLECVSAVMSNNTVAVSALLEQGVDPNLVTDKLSPLHFACEHGLSAVVEILLDAKADPNLVFHGISPLFCAVYSNHYTVVKSLLQHGANPNQKMRGKYLGSHIVATSFFGRAPLVVASRFGSFELVSLLLENNADPNIVDEDINSTALLAASSTEFCLERDEMKAFRSTLHPKPSFESLYAIIELLLRCGADPDFTGMNNGAFALMIVSVKTTRLLLRAGANPNIRNHNHFGSWTALMMTCFRNDIQKACVLLHSGKTNPNLFSIDKQTALMLATYYGYNDMVSLLLTYKADVNAQLHGGQTALTTACVRDRFEIMTQLLEAGANPNLLEDKVHHLTVVDQNNTSAYKRDFGPRITALMLSSRYGTVESVKLLLRHHAMIEQRDGKGWTPLHYAVAGNPDIKKCEVLLAAGVNLTLQDVDGYTAIDVASMVGKMELAEFLNQQLPQNQQSLPTYYTDSAIPKDWVRGRVSPESVEQKFSPAFYFMDSLLYESSVPRWTPVVEHQELVQRKR